MGMIPCQIIKQKGPIMSALGQKRTSGRVRVAPLSCVQFFRYALHSLQAIWVGWSELRMHFEVGQCLSQAVLLLPSNAAVVVGLGILRIEPDCLVEVRDRPVEVALGAPGAAAVVVGVREFRTKPDRFGIVRDGAVEVVLGFPNKAAAVIGFGILRIEPDRLVEVRDGPVVVALGGPGGGAVGVGVLIFG